MLRGERTGTINFGVKMRSEVAEGEVSGARRLREVLGEMRRVAGDIDLAVVKDGMARFGVQAERVIGLTTPQLRTLARSIGRNQALAEALWDTGIHDCRILASLIGDPYKITRKVMERWVRDFASWDVCDACCCNLFDKSPHAWAQIAKWAKSRREFVRRAAFATIAALAVHDKTADDRVFREALMLVEQYAFDDRNFVKKAVNWALRNIGKRNGVLLMEAIACGERIRLQGTRSARWIAADALRELKVRVPGYRNR